MKLYLVSLAFQSEVATSIVVPADSRDAAIAAASRSLGSQGADWEIERGRVKADPIFAGLRHDTEAEY